MFDKFILAAIVFSLVLKYFVFLPVIGRIGAEGPLGYLLVASLVASLVFTLGVLGWLVAKSLRSR